MIKQMKKGRYILAILLCMGMLLESTGMQVLAGTMQEELVISAATDETAAADNGSTDGSDSNSVIASGTYCKGVTWTLYGDGLLIIEGTATNDNERSKDWLERTDVKNIKMRVSGLVSLRDLFKGAGAQNLESVDFTGSDFSKVTRVDGMFWGCSNLKSVNLGGCTTGKLTNMENMFYGCESLESVDLTGAATGSEASMFGMFWDCSSLKTVKFGGINMANVTNMNYLFYNCNSLKNIDLSCFDTSNVTNMNYMFYNCSNLQSIDLSNFDTGNVAEMVGMFSGCSSLNSLNVSGLNTSNVTRMENLFWGCSNLKNLDLRGFDVSKVTSLEGMFYGCTSLESVNLSGLNVSKVTDMSSMFFDCSGLKNVNLSGLNASGVTDMAYMFRGCSKLKSVDLSGFTSKVKNMESVFDGCGSLENLDLSKLDLANVIERTYMFRDCISLKKIKAPINNSCTDIGLPCIMYDAEGNSYTCLPRTGATSITLSVTVGGTGDGSDETENGSTGDGNDGGNGGTEDGNDGGNGGTEDGNETENGGTGDGNDAGNGGTGDGNDAENGGTGDSSNDAENGGTGDGDENGATGDGNDFGNSDGSGDNNATTDGGDLENGEIILIMTVSAIPDQIYTGKALKPEVTVTYGKTTLKAGKDYTVTYKNNTNAAKAEDAKAPMAVVKGKGNFEGTVNVAFNILAQELTEENTDISQMISYTNGNVQTAKPVVKVNGKKLTLNKDYTITQKDKTEGAYKDAGTYTVTIAGKGNYTGSVNATMTILSDTQVMASKLKIAAIPAQTYEENKPATPAPKVTYKGKELKYGEDYAIEYSNNDRAGKATLRVIGLQNTAEGGTYVAGSVSKTFIIKGTTIKKTKVSYDTKATYTGQEITPAVTLSYNDTTLTEGKDYQITYSKNIKLGKGTITITGCGGYTGTVKKTFTIQADTSVTDKLIVAFENGKAEATYNAKGAKPAITVTLGTVTLKAGTDYTLTYKNNKKLAKAGDTKAPTIVIKGKGNYKFTKAVTFSITEKDLSDTDISMSCGDKFVGDRKGYLSTPVVKDANGSKLKAGKDYKILGYLVSGKNFDGKENVPAGTEVMVTLEGMGNYTGSSMGTYRIAESDISKVKTNKAKVTYNGSNTILTEEMLKQGVLELTDKNTKETLVYGTDYIITGYKNNGKKGTATVTVKGIGSYGGTKDVKFTITGKNMADK